MEVETLLASGTDAASEVARLLALRGVQRDTFRLVVPLDTETAVLDLGDVVTLTYPRYGLNGGRLLRVLGVSPDAVRGQLTMTVWG